MKRIWTRLLAVFVAFAMLQVPAFMGRAVGEARSPEDSGDPGTVAAEEAEKPDSSPAPWRDTADGAAGQNSYVFRPRVCSAYMEEVFGKTMCETWFHLVDAVMAGEDTFACPDQYTYDWVMGQFPIRCFPVLTELIDYAYNREHSVVDGVASFTYLVPREEAARRIGEFAQQVEGVLNEALEADDSDFEKVLALYDYFVQHYTYDDETEKKIYETFVDYTTPFRLFREGTGICTEIARAYSYLLMQAGVDAGTVMGDAHEWSCVRINGVHYHVDPTFAITSPGSLAFFMMTDEQREATGFNRDGFVYLSNYSEDHPHPEYTADDDTFSALWDWHLEAFSRPEKILRCWKYQEGWEKSYFDFDYTGF